MQSEQIIAVAGLLILFEWPYFLIICLAGAGWTPGGSVPQEMAASGDFVTGELGVSQGEQREGAQLECCSGSVYDVCAFVAVTVERRASSNGAAGWESSDSESSSEEEEVVQQAPSSEEEEVAQQAPLDGAAIIAGIIPIDMYT